MAGRDAFGRCLSKGDRIMRGLSDVLPLLGKLRGLGGATRLATEAGCSFAAGTPIVMADGTSRAVETLHAGDYVLAKDEKTGHIEAQEVTATVHHPAATLVTVTFAGADGKTQAIVCTPEHPFFVDGKGWVEAGSLGIGTSIVTRAGPLLSVKSLDWKRSAPTKHGLTTPAFTVYNFTVDQDHTFFVGTANGGAWTHNGGCRWKLGDPIDAGVNPSWGAVKRRYWRNATGSSTAPFDPVYGAYKELHHINGRQGINPHNASNIVEVWPWEHDAIDRNRYYTGPKPPGAGPGF